MSQPITTQQLMIDDATFKAALGMTLSFEGGVDKNQVGKSGISNAGITQQTYDSYLNQRKMPLKNVTQLDDNEKQEFYYNEFYEKPKLNMLPDKTAVILFDYGVNASPRTAVKALQRAVGTTADGVVGPKTLKAVNEYINEKGEQDLLQKIIEDRETHNNRLIKNKPETYGKFKDGWENRIKTIKEIFNLSSLNPFEVKEAEAGEVSEPMTTQALLKGGHFDEVNGQPSGVKTSDLMQPDDLNKIEKVSAAIADTLQGIYKKIGVVEGDLGKSVVIGTETVAASVGTMLQWMGDNIAEMNIGLQSSEAEDNEIYAQMVDMGVHPDDIAAIRQEVTNQRENIKRREAVLDNVGKKISELGNGIYKFITRHQQNLAASRDPETFRGTFMENPSFARGAALIAEGLPVLTVGTAVTFATGSPLAGAAVIGFPIEGGNTYQQAREAGKSVQEANAYALASGIGTTILENIPLTRFLRGGSGKMGKDILIGGLQEGGEEVLQAALNNMIAIIGFDETRKITEGMVEGLIAGAGTGGLIGGFTSGRVQLTDQAVQNAIAKGVNPKDLEIVAQGLTGQILANKDAIDKAITENANNKSINSFSAEQMKDFKNLMSWELDQQDGGKQSHGPAEDLTFTQPKSGHSQAMQDIGPKNSFAILQKILSDELLTETEMQKAMMLLEDYQLIKPEIDAINQEIDDAGNELTQQEKTEVLDSFKKEAGNVEYDWEGNAIQKDPGNITKEDEAEYGTKDAFFSKLEQTIEEKMPNAAPADQVMSILKANGVKQEEIEYLDIESFLEGKAKVTKAEVLEYVRQNRIQIEEVEKLGEKEDLKLKELSEASGRATEEFNKIQAELGNRPYVSGNPLRWMYLDREKRINVDVPEKYIKQLDDIQERHAAYDKYVDSIDNDRSDSNEAKFGSFQLPGGENYKELLLTLPGQELSDEEVKKAYEQGRIPREGENDFISQHFGERNILAHVRFNERTDAQGKKVLFIEEVQSDWHQKGRREGYNKKIQLSEVEKLMKEEPARFLIEQNSNWLWTNREGSQQGSVFKSKEKALQAARNWLNEVRSEGVPNAPFRKTWHELVMKRMIRYAADKGFDRVAWTTGQQQADRYDLSKQVDEIQTRNNGDDTFDMEVVIDGVKPEDLAKKNISIKELENFIGKDLAKKTQEQEPDEWFDYKGNDLKVGGEGMKGFYDMIIPSFVSKYIKKWNSKIEPISIKTVDTLLESDSESVNKRIEGLKKLIREAEENDDLESAAIYQEELDAEYAEITVQSFEITPAMKRAVLQQGQPLFETPENYVRIESRQLTFDDLQPEKDVSDGKQELSDRDRNIKVNTATGVKTISQSPFAIKWQKDRFLSFPAQEVTSPADIAFAFQFLKDAGVENLYVGAIKDGKVVSVEFLTIGTIHYASTSNFEVFNLLQAEDADGYFLVHNHPAGTMQPSKEDIIFTRAIVNSVKNKKFYGHIIINDGEFVNITENYDWDVYQHKTYAKTRKVPVLRKYVEWSKSKKTVQNTVTIKSSGDVYELAKGIKTGKDEGILFNLDTANKILSSYIMPAGMINAENLIDLATRNRSNKIIVVEPSGEKVIGRTNQEADNIQLKEQLKDAGIALLDRVFYHGGDVFESSADKGLMEPGGDYKRLTPKQQKYYDALLKKKEMISKFGSDIPAFKNTEEAIAYGISIRGNEEAIERLRAAKIAKNQETDKNFQIQNPTDADIQAGIDLAVAGQFLREALEEAESGRIFKTDELTSPTPEKDQSLKIEGTEPTQGASEEGFSEDAKIQTIVDKIRGKDAGPIATPSDFEKFVSQLNKFAQSQAILRKNFKSRKLAGLFVRKGGVKPGEVKINDIAMVDPQTYMSVLAHELGHALDFNVTGRTGSKTFELFGKKLDFQTIQTLKSELIAVTEKLEPGSTFGKQAKYYLKPAELVARFFEKMIVSPGDLGELAPTALELIEKQAIIHPIIAEFLEAAGKQIDKGSPRIVLMRDLRQTYQKYLGKRVGNIAFGEEMAYRAMKERGKLEIEKLIESKFKNVKDSPELLFRAVESIKITEGDEPTFGTRDFVTPKTEEEERQLIELGYELVEMPVIEDQEARPVYARWRYTKAEGKAIFEKLSEAGKRLVKDFTAARDEAKDYFNREVIKDVNNINGQIEGWVHHYFEDRPNSAMKPGQRFQKRVAGTRKHRTGQQGYVKDFKLAMSKVLIDLESEKVFNDFINRQFARVTEAIAQGANPKPGWIEVQGNLKSGVGTRQETKKTLIDSKTGNTIPVRQQRYQMPKEIYERYKLWRGLIDEASTVVRIVNDINRYWRINILTHPGTPSTNNFSGGIQYSTKILTDFYTEVLTGNIDLPQTKANLSAIIKVLLPKGWVAAPDWVYGGDLSNFYGQFMKHKSPVSKAIDEYGNKALKLFGIIERYWKKVILTADGVADLESLGKMTKEGLRLPTEGERQLLAKLNEAVDLYAYDYDNVPFWLEAHQKSALGQSIKPFAKYPYKYAKHVLNYVEAAYDGSLSWQERTAKILTLVTIAAAYGAFSRRRKEEQQTPEAEEGIDIPARLQPRGRLFVHTDEEGREMFARMAKYPFVNLTEAGIQVVDGHFEGAKDLMAEMLGSIGPTAQIGMLAINYRNKYQMYDSVPVIIGNSLVTFTPGYRILNDVSQMLDPWKRKQTTFAQTFTRIIPTTSEALQEKLHGNIRTERVPIEGEIQGEGGRRTTVDRQLPNYWQDTLLSLLSGIYINRVDPKIAEAYIIRKTKNLEKKKENDQE